MSLKNLVPGAWQELLSAEYDKSYFPKLEEFLAEERATQTIYPPEEEVFSALQLTPYENVKVLILGQDPYHGPGQAHGLSFSVKDGIKIPPSLRNMYKELASDLECITPKHGTLTQWAEQGVLMLNAVLTVRHKTPNSHKSKGWEKFTDAIIKQVNAKEDKVVFVLWGGYAKKKARLIDEDRHVIISSAHPSPLSARHGFFGSKPFSKVNAALEEAGREPIDWQLPLT